MQDIMTTLIVMIVYGACVLGTIHLIYMIFEDWGRDDEDL